MSAGLDISWFNCGSDGGTLKSNMIVSLCVLHKNNDDNTDTEQLKE